MKRDGLDAAEVGHRMRTADAVGLRPTTPEVDLADVMRRIRRAQATLAAHDSPERLRRAGVEVVQAPARFVRPGVVDVGGRQVAYRRALIATGSRPVVPPIAGLDEVDALTSDTVWDLRQLPKRLLVLGGGPTGCELGQAFQRLDSRVTLVERRPRLRAVHPYPTFARGVQRAADEHLRERWLSPRVRAVTRPSLTLLRYLERP